MKSLPAPMALLAVFPLATAAQTPPPIDLPPGVIATRDVAYVPDADERQVLDLYVPSTNPRPVPVILVIHGGAWRANDKARNNSVRWVIPVLLRAGYAVASMNYRYSSQALFPAQIHDAKAALRWLGDQEQNGIDGERIGVWGDSSGGHLASLLGTSAGVTAMDGSLGDITQPTRVRAVVAWFPPTDFLAMQSQRLPGDPFQNTPDSPEAQLLGGLPQDRPEAATAASPMSYITADDAPFLLYHGAADRTVPYQQSELLRDALEAAGVEVQLHIFPTAVHADDQFRVPVVAEQMLEFFDRHVRPN